MAGAKVAVSCKLLKQKSDLDCRPCHWDIEPKCRVPVTASIAWPNFHPGDGRQVDKQTAAAAESKCQRKHTVDGSGRSQCQNAVVV